MHRIFNQTERNTLFIQSNGHCALCGEPLDATWQADHIVPYALHGQTDVANGQALCAKCNQQKGVHVKTMLARQDTITLRKAQIEMENIALSKLQRGEKSMTCILACGSGKTLGAINLCNALYRLGIINGAIFLTPREALCKQYQTAWTPGHADDFSKFYDTPKIHGLYYRENKAPILFKQDFGYALIYNSLVADSKTATPIHTNPATGIVQRKFALILDEAQALSKEDEKAFTAAVKRLYDHPNCMFTVVMSATPIRSDNLELFCGDYTEPDANGYRYLKPDVLYTYRDGVEQGYLRPFEFHLEKVQIDLQEWSGDTETEIVSVQSDEKEADNKLRRFIEQDIVWHNLVDKTVEELRAVRERYWQEYRAMIAAIDVKHAGRISAYLKAKYPALRTLTVVGETMKILEQSQEINESIGDLSDKLTDFKQGSYDILISVRKAYVGFNCPAITVVGVLTHWRFPGFLEQLTGRGGRVCKERPVEEQVLRVVGLDDRAMAQFAKDMREASLPYLIEKGLRQPPTVSGIDYPPPPLELVVRVELHGNRAIAWQETGDLSREQYQALQARLMQKNLYGVPMTSIAQIISEADGDLRVFLGELHRVPSASVEYEADIEAIRSGIEEQSQKLAGIYTRQMNISWQEAKMQVSHEFFPQGIKHFHKNFQSEQAFRIGLLEKLSQINQKCLLLKKRHQKEAPHAGNETSGTDALEPGTQSAA